MAVKSPLQILEQAREKIAKPGGWTQHTYARTKGGDEVSAMEAPARCFCALGALQRVAHGVGKKTTFAYDVTAARHDAAHILKGVVRRRGFGNIPKFNDNPKTTQYDVVCAFDEAIEDAKRHLIAA